MLTTLAPMIPVQAASMAHMTITANPMAPLIGPKRCIIERKSPSEMPDFPRKEAIRTNWGMAMRMLLVVESNARPWNR